MNKFIRTLAVTYDIDLEPREIPLFRGAVIGSFGGDANLLYHNHLENNKLRYSYPLIQYKRLGRKAAIICVEEGADIIGQFIGNAPQTISMGERNVTLKTMRITPARILMQVWNSMFEYKISRWLPLNPANYRKYQAMESLAERIKMLEKILCSNILSMLKGLGIWLEEDLKVSITDIGKPYKIYNKSVALMAFDASFTSNLSIPDNLGIGKNVSIGYGTVFQIKKSKSNIEDETK
ncbi:MAG: CRISPR-associated endonuclease Cas6 [Prevotella sp.]|uniref:CRISPR-associated endonuclease Cas6 n=1 Tax=Prevotella sp. TaxID=59823 RepID=UPI002A346D1C|nr:CRISPR-associated endonuclease Cas6 [Prevotella sp.]MDD7318981.1 CRISPR-associated endonuclease Cas6 [Prevotellaceae bacterium]MDY4020007.1 CRISPR-associated endonuclease Cas6 [Prevotella sp.]